MMDDSEKAHTVRDEEQLYLLHRPKWFISEARLRGTMHARADGWTVDPRGSQQKQLQGEVTPTITTTTKLNHRTVTPICPMWQETLRVERASKQAEHSTCPKLTSNTGKHGSGWIYLEELSIWVTLTNGKCKLFADSGWTIVSLCTMTLQYISHVANTGGDHWTTCLIPRPIHMKQNLAQISMC